ncbi:alpha/beta-hydrolase [Coprinopsis marcescibilis]|uniref:Alpha/beta-hydrolase n=1 Tax=Coprinopsis marcescibilis TaxID=230819 RepID=A0A5C3L015_COPMA|nr:alpha/beta-hydrolase [Coprinopsis marcescibilis]
MVFGTSTIKLTEEQRRMYTAEQLDNFRWIFQVLASRSPVALTSTDVVHPEVKVEIEAAGQFAELVYSGLPLQLLLDNYEPLSLKGFPLEGYHLLREATLIDSFSGTVANLPVAIFSLPSRKQTIIAISGTSNLGHAVQDLRVAKVPHPSGKGMAHTGFLSLYLGLKSQVKSVLEANDITELVLTGHSMGGAVAYLLCIDILSEGHFTFKSPPVIKLVTFGLPRVGDSTLVFHFRGLADQYRDKHGWDSFSEYSVRAFNDGVPTLPPQWLGYRHFPKHPIYSTGDQLYIVPESECEYALFHTNVDGDEDKAPCFPRGGHNYYNGRELERLLRRITWLEKANVSNEGWENRYKLIMEKA